MTLDLRRALGWGLWLAAITSLLLSLHGVAYLLGDEFGDALMIFEMSGSIGFGALLLPLIAALPFGTGFAADCQYAYALSVVPRSGRAKYLRSKILTAALSGGLACVLGMASFLAFVYWRFPTEALIENAPYLAARLALTLLAGAFWAMTALTFSAFYPNIPLTLCAPLVMYRLLEELGQAPGFPAHFNVTLLSDGLTGLDMPETLGMAALVYGGLIAVLSALFAWRAGRRLRNA